MLCESGVLELPTVFLILCLVLYVPIVIFCGSFSVCYDGSLDGHKKYVGTTILC